MPDDQRNRPEGSVDRLRSGAARQDPDRAVSASTTARRRPACACRTRRGTFGPGQERVDLGCRAPAPGRRALRSVAASRPAARAPRRRPAARRLSARGAGRAASLQRRAPAGRRRRPEPLKERRAAEQIEIERVRVIGQVETTQATSASGSASQSRARRELARRFTSLQRVDATRRAPRRARARRRARRRRRRALPLSPTVSASRRETASRQERPTRRGTSSGADARCAWSAVPPVRRRWRGAPHFPSMEPDARSRCLLGGRRLGRSEFRRQ